MQMSVIGEKKHRHLTVKSWQLASLKSSNTFEYQLARVIKTEFAETLTPSLFFGDVLLLIVCRGFAENILIRETIIGAPTASVNAARGIQEAALIDQHGAINVYILSEEKVQWQARIVE